MDSLSRRSGSQTVTLTGNPLHCFFAVAAKAAGVSDTGGSLTRSRASEVALTSATVLRLTADRAARGAVVATAMEATESVAALLLMRRGMCAPRSAPSQAAASVCWEDAGRATTTLFTALQARRAAPAASRTASASGLSGIPTASTESDARLGGAGMRQVAPLSAVQPMRSRSRMIARRTLVGNAPLTILRPSSFATPTTRTCARADVTSPSVIRSVVTVPPRSCANPMPGATG